MEFMSKFLLKFLWWCISHELMIRNHSYFNRRYPIGFVCFVSVSLDPASMPGVGARGQKSRSPLLWVKVLVQVSLVVYIA